MTGTCRYLAGLTAEDQVQQLYCRNGAAPVHKRWRGPGGEIDLILQDGPVTVFVEVKKSRDFARAAARVTRRQLERISNSALAFLATLPGGQVSEMRIDVALVDGMGRIECLENVMMS